MVEHAGLSFGSRMLIRSLIQLHRETGCDSYPDEIEETVSKIINNPTVEHKEAVRAFADEVINQRFF